MVCCIAGRRPLAERLLSAASALFARPARDFGRPADAAAAVRAAQNRRAERLLSEYGNAVLRLAYSYLHCREDAEEVLQDTLLQFLKASPGLESPGHEKAWLLRVAANLAKNRIRYNALRRTDELSEELAAEEREDLAFVWEAVRALPERYRAAIHLFYHEGCSTAEIAEILGMKEATVRSHLARGRERLRAVLKEAYDFEPEVR